MGPMGPLPDYMPPPKNLKKLQKIKNWIRARGLPPRPLLRPPPSRPAAGLNPILDFLIFFRLYMAADKREGQQI